MKKHFVYVLFSKTRGHRFYVGMTANFEQRFQEHNSGKVFSTKGYCPWELLFIEEYDSREEARDREKYLKGGSGKEKIKRIYWVKFPEQLPSK